MCEPGCNWKEGPASGKLQAEGFPVRSCYGIWGYRAGPVGRQMQGLLLRVGVPWRGVGPGERVAHLCPEQGVLPATWSR